MNKLIRGVTCLSLERAFVNPLTLLQTLTLFDTITMYLLAMRWPLSSSRQSHTRHRLACGHCPADTAGSRSDEAASCLCCSVGEEDVVDR